MHSTSIRAKAAGIALGALLAAAAGPALADDPVTLTLGSWRTEDIAVWQDKVLPAFEAAHPGHQGRVRADQHQ